MKRPMTCVLAVAALMMVTASCAINPATGRNQLMLVSESQGIAMGRQADTAIIATIGLYADATWQNYIQQFGARLATTSERPELPWTFRVVDDPAVNAFAVPGGFVYVTRGLLAHLNSEAELASVVGHEIGHITARHTAAEMSKQQVLGLGLVVGSIASSQVAKYAGIVNQGLGILYLKFSRDDESQSDELGLRYMRRANYDPREMPAVFHMLEQVSAAEGGGRLPTWLATHPSPENRVVAINQQIAALPQNFSGTLVNHDSYVRRLDDQVFGENPREGYFQGSLYFHPELRFQFTLPEGWATHNGKQAVVAVSAAKDAVVELSPAQGTSADAAARAFLTQQGITAGTMSRASLHGLPTVSAPFGAETTDGTLRGTVLFVEHRGTIYQIVGYAPESRWSANQAAAERALQSFQPLTDPAALNVQPQRVDILKLDRRTTIEAMARERASPASAATLALINQVDLQTPLESGRLIKWIVGQPVPNADSGVQQTSETQLGSLYQYRGRQP